MKLSEMKRLPKRAGLARLYFNGVLVPRRKGNQIFLPMYSLPMFPDAKFFQLQRGRQFLFQIPSEGTAWFGGTDENPFLVELRKEAFKAFKKGGQKGFYEALKPEIIRAVEKRFNVVSKRQGDIWAAPVPSWDDVNLAMLLCFGGTIKPRTVKSKSIFGTRHRLTGLCDPGLRDQGWNNAPMFAEGILKSPDHSPMELKGVHVLAQTRHLANSRKAD